MFVCACVCMHACVIVRVRVLASVSEFWCVRQDAWKHFFLHESVGRQFLSGSACKVAFGRSKSSGMWKLRYSPSVCVRIFACKRARIHACAHARATAFSCGTPIHPASAHGRVKTSTQKEFVCLGVILKNIRISDRWNRKVLNVRLLALCDRWYASILQSKIYLDLFRLACSLSQACVTT